MTTYAEKLKDPRWQKKRLLILEDRDWTCEQCLNRDSTLNVHHKIYKKGVEPWDYEPHVYVVLCDGCHTDEHNGIGIITKCLVNVLKEKFLAGQISDISVGFNYMKEVHTGEVVASAIGWALSDEKMMRDIVARYFKSLKGTK